ncbi:MAG: hypothetical protein IPL61_15545 [Myxococcales bacterium]|nr:hypothetical protein [Myxococcales bacterium]
MRGGRAAGTRARVVAVAAVASAWLPAARADEPGALAAPTLVAPRALVLAAVLEGRLDGDHADLAADAWYGVSDRLTLGVRHSLRSVGAIGDGRGLCLRGCRAGDERYRGLALTARFPLIDGRTRVIGEVATDVTGWSPGRAAVVIGAIAHWRDERVWAQAAPRLAIGLVGRADGNREVARVDVTVGVAIRGPVGLELGVGAVGPGTREFFADATAPAWTQVVVRPTPRWGVGAAIGTDDIVGGSARSWFGAITVEVRATP